MRKRTLARRRGGAEDEGQQRERTRVIWRRSRGLGGGDRSCAPRFRTGLQLFRAYRRWGARVGVMAPLALRWSAQYFHNISWGFALLPPRLRSQAPTEPFGPRGVEQGSRNRGDDGDVWGIGPIGPMGRTGELEMGDEAGLVS